MLFSLMKFLPGRPWIILIAILGVIYGFVFSCVNPDGQIALLQTKYPEMIEGAKLIDFKYLSKEGLSFKQVFIGSIEVAFVAVLETLISARIADNKTGTRFVQDKEVLGMSLGNILSGSLGGTPVTGVLVRTGANIASGATDKLSQFLNAISVLIMVVVLMPVILYLPMSVIAAILMTSAFRLMPLSVMGQLLKEDIPELIILLATTFVCVYIDGAFGLLTGCFLCLLRNAANNTSGQIETAYEEPTLNVYIAGQLSYINGLGVEISAIDAIKKDTPEFVVLNCEKVQFIDVDGVQTLLNIMKLSKHKDFSIVLPKNEEAKTFITNSQWYLGLGDLQNMLVENAEDAQGVMEANKDKRLNT